MMRKVQEIGRQGASVSLRIDIETETDSSGQFINHSKHKAHSATINHLHEKNAKVLLLAHDSINAGHETMRNHANCLSEYCEPDVEYIGNNCDIHEAFNQMQEGDVFLYTNLSEVKGCVEEYESIDECSDLELIDSISTHSDAYVNDTFALSNNRYPTILGIPTQIPGYAGKRLSSEYHLLRNITDTEEKATFHFSGSKDIDKKVKSIHKILKSKENVQLLSSGLFGCTFLMVDGYNLGENTTQLIEERISQETRDRIYEILTRYAGSIYLPKDLVAQDDKRTEYSITATPLTSTVQDVGSETIGLYKGLINQSKYVFSTGIVKDHIDEYSHSTEEIYSSISEQRYGIIAGNKTIHACDNMNLTGFSHTSVDFEAVCDYISGENVDGIDVLLP